MKPAEKQLVFIVEVHVESRSTHIRAVQNFLHRNGLVFLFKNE